MAHPLAELHAAVEEAAGALEHGPVHSRPTLERPKQAGFGDYSTNVAMLLAPAAGAPPRDVAEQVGEQLRARLGDRLADVQVAGPGFLNLILADGWYVQALAHVLEAGDEFGAGRAGAVQRLLVEFVSANPTGPLTAASGRHAAYGDAVARLLEFAGHDVQREYYFNDAGTQIRNLGLSIQARARGEEPPEDGYEGAYVEEIARRLREEGADPEALGTLARRGVELMLEQIRAVLHDYGVDFDSWFSERALHDSDAVAQTLERLRETGNTYESEGALWLRTTEFGDDKDRVLVRAGGEPTYFGGDVAYHANKLDRAFRRLVVVLGADHHGYTARMRAALGALGAPDAYQATIMQLVNVVEGGERSQMSKRRGEFVTLAELIADIGVDATRFFMLQRSHDTPVNLDLDLARRQSNENPVYYVQYAHARIASILRNAGEEAVARAERLDPALAGAPLEPSERQLVKRLLELPGEVLEAAERRAPHRLTAYATAVAADFHAFYRDCRVIGAEGEGVEQFRLGLSLAAKRTIARTLELLGVSAPERM